ncbi:MAG: hypothetical protein KDA22_08360 [Phycisphaerales bacterium]|nr:hypothetical protein [Phycisphaerales bacterium]
MSTLTLRGIRRVAGIGVLLATASAVASPPLDLTGWTLFDPDNDWAASNPTPTSVRLDEQVSSPSVHPGWFVSDFTLAPTATIEFDLSVAAGTGDDDLIGFGFSYLDGTHSYLLDWKKSTQSFNWGQPTAINDDVAEQGLKIKRINGSYTWDGLWGGTDGIGVSTIAGPAGGGWVAGTVYHFVVELEPGHIVVTRDGNPIFDVLDPEYPGGQGAITIYGFSQDNIIASEICITPLPTLCPPDLNNDGVVDGADLGLLLAAWGSANQDADLDDSGMVDGADLGLMLAGWGPCVTN